MELQSLKPKGSSRPAIAPQMRASNMRENQNTIENSKHHYHHHSSINNPQIQVLFDSKTGLLNSAYCDNIIKSEHKSMLSMGVCLSSENITLFFKQLYNQIGRSTHGINRLTERREINKQIYFISSISYKIQNCTIIFWIIQDLFFHEFQQKKQINKLLQIFITYPQIMIIDSSMMELIKVKKKHFNNLLKFQQSIIFISDTRQLKHENLNHEEIDKFKIHWMSHVDLYSIKNLMLLTMKRNPMRCFQETLKINLYILQSLNFASSSLKKLKYDLSNDENLRQIFQTAASKYLSQVEKQYELLSQSMKNRAAKSEKQLQHQLNEYEQFCMRDIRRNIHILNLEEEEKKYFEPAERIIYVNNQQILANNRELIKKQNNELLTELYDKLLSQFEKGRYNNTKDRIYLMAYDLESMMKEFEKKAIKSSSLFWIFNTFMRNNRNKYYQKIQSIEEQIDHNKKNQNFDEIFDKILIKKKVLFTLEKEVQNLENKKGIIEKENEHLKKLQKELNERANFESEDEEVGEADSIKTMRNKQILIDSSQKNESNVAFNSQKNKIKLKAQKIQKKKKCLDCCQII